MTGLIVEFPQRAKARKRSARGDHCEANRIAHVHYWDVDLVPTLFTESRTLPPRQCARWTIVVDNLQRRWEVTVWREGWQHSQTFQGGDGSALRLLNELLSASYGIPA